MFKKQGGSFTCLETIETIHTTLLTPLFEDSSHIRMTVKQQRRNVSFNLAIELALYMYLELCGQIVGS